MTLRKSSPAAPSGLMCRGVLAYCRAGFEGELAAELMRRARREGIEGHARAREGSAFVLIAFNTPREAGDLAEAFAFDQFVFARQSLLWLAEVAELPERDRITPLLAALREAGFPAAEQLLLESADNDVGAGASGFCKRFAAPLQTALTKAGLLRARAHGLCLHVFVPDMQRAHLAIGLAGCSSTLPMGVMRLRMSRDAPSRSTLKLAEAFKVLLSEEEATQWLRAGARAVDLGAAPGGWSWLLAQRGLRVTAVDNGPMAASVLATEMVEHVRADGFTYRPRGQVEWLVCDMVEQPSRIAALVADWVAAGRCRRAIFNLKLPMKKRLQAVDEAVALLYKRLPAGQAVDLRLKHLYHDREEITAYLALTGEF